MKNGTNRIPQDGTFTDDSMISVHEFQTQAQSLKDGTQMFDDYSDGFGSELDDGICDTQVLDGSEDTCQDQRGSLDGERPVLNVHSYNNDTRLDDMEGSFQIVDDPKDMFRNQLANSGTSAEVNKNMTCAENLFTEIINDDSEQLWTEGLVTTSDEQTPLGNNGLCSSREVDHCKSSSDCLTDITLEHTSGMSVADAANNKDDTSGYLPPKFTEIRKESMLASAASGQSRLETKNSELNCSTSTITNQSSRKQDEKGSSKSGYVPPRFTEIRIEAWLEYGLEVKRRAQSGNAAGTICSVGTIPAKQKLVDKENRMFVKGSPSNREGTDDEDFSAFNEPKDGRKVKSSAVRKLFAEELGPHTEEACGNISTGKDESEPPVGEGDTNAAGLSYIYSQEPNDIAHAKALDFVEKFLTENIMDIDTNDSGGTRMKKTNAVAHSNCKQSSKKSILRNFVGVSKAFDWDDDNEDEGGGVFFCKLKEKTSKKESDFVKPAPLIQKFNASGKKRKLSYSEKKFVSQNMKRAAKNIEENANENVINVRNRDCTGNIASHQNTLDMIIACKDVSACTSALKESHAGRDTNLLNSKEIGPSEVVSMGRTRRGSYIKVLNMRKRARPTSDKVSDNSVQSMQIHTGWGKGMSQDAPTHNQDAKLIEQAMEVSACAGKTTRSGNGHISKDGSSGNYPGQKGLVDQVKPTQSKAKTSSKSKSGQAHQMLNKNAIPRRSCRLNKVTKLEDSHKQQLSRGSNDSTLEHSGLTNDKEVMHLPFQVDASLEVLYSEYSLKRLTWRSAWPSEQNGKKRVFPDSELTSGESTQHEITNGTTANLKINGSQSIRDDRKSYRNNKTQGKNSRNMTCIRQTRRASLQRSLKPAETVRDDFVKPIEQPADHDHAKRTRTTSSIGHDPVAVNSIDTSIKVTNNQVCQVQPVKHHMQFELTSLNKIVGDPMNISSNQKRIPLRRSHRLNGLSKIEDPSLQNVNKQASAGATEDQLSHTDFGTSLKGTLHKVETSPRVKTYIPCMNCVTPANTIKPFEEASPICMGNEYNYISCKQIPSGSNLKKEVSKLVTLSPKLSSGKKDSRKWRVMTDVRVLFSRHLDETTLKQQKKILDQLGASLASSLSDATHFIADKFVRTKNMLEAIALGKPVVTPVWLLSCCETKTHIDEKNYILRDVKKEKEFGFSMPVSLDSARFQPLLKKRRVFTTPNTKPGKEAIACLVKAVGGQVVERITGSALRYHNTRDSLLILTCEEDFAICSPFMEKGAKVYSSELLLNGIVTQRLEFERYRLFDDDRGK